MSSDKVAVRVGQIWEHKDRTERRIEIMRPVASWRYNPDGDGHGDWRYRTAARGKQARSYGEIGSWNLRTLYTLIDTPKGTS